MILECCKTGRWWTVRSNEEADRIARREGVTDYYVRRHPATNIRKRAPTMGARCRFDPVPRV